MRFFRCVPVFALLCAAAVSHANSMSYTFTYNGLGEIGNLSDPGSGSLTYTYTPGSTTGTLSAFSFTDALQATDGTKSTFTYSLSSIVNSTIVLSANGQIASIALDTKLLLGSNAKFGATSFGLYYGAQLSSYTEGDVSSNYYNYGNSDGSAVLTLAPSVATTPEPSSIALLGTGLVGVAGVLRRRFV